MSSQSFITRIDPSQSLKQAWDALAKKLRASGAKDFQIESMEMSFYVGATQAYALVAKSALEDDDETFTVTMDGMRANIMEHMEKNHALIEPEGNA